MDVICSGWGRTGTRSLKRALEILLKKPSYHMQNILLNRKDAKLWHDLIFNNVSDNYDWDRIYKGYGACLDFPSCNYYKELMSFYPNAKIILTIRDDQSWIKSWNVLENKILKSFTFKFLSKIPNTSFKLQKDIHNKMIINEAFKGHLDDKNRMIEFNKWNHSVKEYVQDENILVYQVKEGWEPLCNFLGLPIPDEPFPYLNKTKNMGHMSRFINFMFIFIIIVSIAMIIASVFFGVQYFR
tara:strand:- start:365 stop:1087 length:723 start_codon:yes stop_codon:yes gene_type:complete